jgi:succinyl-CoA synthetase beta subunit
MLVLPTLLVAEDEAPAAPLVGTHSVGGDESLVVLDALESVGVRAANYCDTSGSPSRGKVAFAAELVASQRHISGLLFSTCIANQPLTVTAHGLADGLTAAGWKKPAVFRIAGNEEREAIAIVREWATGVKAPVEILDRSADEWVAAARIAALIRRG